MSLRELLAGLPVDVDTDLASMAEAAFSPDHVYRYALTRTWDPRVTVLPWVMLNPSTADAFRLDPTVTRCVDFSRRWGYGGLIVLNLYALRSTDSRALKTHPAPVGPDNRAVIAAVLEALGWRAPAEVVCAWGANASGGHAGYVLDMIRDAGHRPVCLGRTRSGQPRHPLYVRSTTSLEAV
jgi:hypothetical protein